MSGNRRLDEVVAAVVTALAANHGTGLDLTGRVLRGAYTEPPGVALPCAAVAGATARGRRGPALATWTFDCQVTAVVWAAPVELATASQVARGEELLDVVAYALTTASETVGNALRALPDLDIELEVASDLEGAAEAACVTATLRFSLHRFTAGLSR